MCEKLVYKIKREIIMSLALPLNQDKRDCLQEITNAVMGAEEA